MTLRHLQRLLHLASRDVGDLDAARRGPAVLGRRLARRELWRQIGRLTR